MRRIDERFLETPFYGSSQMRLQRQLGIDVGRGRVRWLMLSGGHHGPAQPGNSVLAVGQDPGRGFLCRRLGRSHESLRGAENFQHGPRIGVHWPGLTQALGNWFRFYNKQ